MDIAAICSRWVQRMRVDLAFGQKGLQVELPEGFRYRVLEARSAVPLDSAEEAVRHALHVPTASPPLRGPLPSPTAAPPPSPTTMAA